MARGDDVSMRALQITMGSLVEGAIVVVVMEGLGQGLGFRLHLDLGLLAHNASGEGYREG